MHYQYEANQPKDKAETLYTVMVTTKDNTYDECECCDITCNIICCAACCDDIGEECTTATSMEYRRSELKKSVEEIFSRHRKDKPKENFSIKIELTQVSDGEKITFLDSKTFDLFVETGNLPTVSEAWTAKPIASAVNRI